jgi:tripartite-type tricarboxylate transporter receptor subunit TctC
MILHWCDKFRNPQEVDFRKGARHAVGSLKNHINGPDSNTIGRNFVGKQITRPLALLAGAAFCALTAGFATAQAYPAKPIRLIAPFPPGGSSDTIARILGQKLTEDWKQRIVVDNRPGASGSIGSGIAAAAPADGYTWVIGSVAPVVLNPLFYKTPYQSLRDFVPVSIIASAPQLIVVKSSFPVKSMKDLIALAKSKPGALNFGSSGSGTLPQLGGLMFNTVTRAKITEIPYKGQAPALVDLLAGQVQVVFADMPVALPYVKSGAFRAIAVAGSKPFPLTPGIPTAIEAGLPGFVLDNWWGLLTPKGVPQNIIDKLNAGIVKALKQPDVIARYTALGIEAVTSTPPEFTGIIKSDQAKYVKVIKDAGIIMEP